MKRCLILIGALILWAALGWAATPPWPQYQHDGQHTGRSQYPGPDNSMLEGGKLQHLPHIKTFGFSPEGIDKSWEAEHYDLVVDSASLPFYKNLNPDMLGVTGKIILYVGTQSSDYQGLKERYDNAGRDSEEIFLHFGTNTKLWLSSRGLYLYIPGWDPINDTNNDGIWDKNNNPNATATTKEQAMVPYDSKESLWLINIGEPIYQDFITEKAYSLVNSDLGDGVTYNWFYAEYLTESPTMPKIGTGGGLIEYKKDTSSKWPEFSSDYIKLIDKIQKRISPKLLGGLAKDGVIPYTVKDKCRFILAKDAVTAIEKKKGLIGNYLPSPLGYWRIEGASYLIQHKVLLHTILGDTPEVRERDRIYGLSWFYIIQEPNLDYFSSYLGTQSTSNDWFEGIEAKVGSPLNDCSVFDEGWDPAVPETKRDSYDKYTVYIREYTNALILIKIRPSDDSKSYGTDSATSYTLDRDYYLLHSDGSTEYPIRTISLPNSSSVILLKERQDTIPPAPVLDLSADASTPKAVFLTWTAKGDDGDIGRASFYDVRYSLSPITEENFNSAEPVSFPWHLLPELSGAIDGITACNLLSDTTYYFALKVLDEADNASSISNCVSIRTLTEPIPGGNFPHIKTYLSLPSAGLTEEQVKWEADHFDFVVFGGDIPRGNLPTYKKYNPKILGVCYTCPDSIYDINSNNSYANRLKKRCEEAHVDFEDMFVHFAEDTRIKMGGVEGVINGWDTVNDSDNNGTVSDDELPFINGSATARNREEARVLGGWGGWARTHFKANMGHSFYRQTMVDFIQERMEQDLEGGVKWDGIYFDCLGTDDLPVSGVITGGEVIEYPDTRNYAEDYIQFLNETRKKIKNKIMRGAAADKLFVVVLCAERSHRNRRDYF